MEHHCYRCESQVEDQTPFCPSCGAPQIRVASRETKPEAACESVPPPPPSLTDPLPQQGRSVRPIRIHWRGFFKVAAPLALISGFTGAYPLLGFPVFLASVIASVYWYRRRHLGPLTVLQGAQLGAFMGLLSYLVLVVPTSAACALQRNLCRDTLISNLALKLNSTPQGQQILQAFQQSDARLFGFLAFTLFVAFLFMLAAGAAAGALAAGLSRDKGA